MTRKLYLLPLALLLLAAGLHADDIVDEIVARVNDSIITRADLEKGKKESVEDLKQRYPADWQSKWPERQKDVLRDLIDRQLLLDKADELSITGEAETAKQLYAKMKEMGLGSMEELERACARQGISFEDFKEQTREEIVTEEVIGQEVGSHLRITHQEIRDWYNAHQRELSDPESMRLAEILISFQPLNPAVDSSKDDSAQSSQLPPDPSQVAQAEARANDVLQQLHGGAKFEDLAKTYSAGSTATLGGEIGEFNRGEMDQQLEDKAFALKRGEVSDVIRTNQGFIIFKALDHREAGVPLLDHKMEDKIRDILYHQRLEPAVRDYLTRLRKQSYIELHEGFEDTDATPNEVKVTATATADDDVEIKQAKGKKK